MLRLSGAASLEASMVKMVALELRRGIKAFRKRIQQCTRSTWIDGSRGELSEGIPRLPHPPMNLRKTRQSQNQQVVLRNAL